jgi:hypothetical protein
VVDVADLAAEGLDVRVFTRSEWGARPPLPKGNVHVPQTQRRGSVYHHDNGDRPLVYADRGGAVRFLQGAQRWHMDHHNWSDIAYSFAYDQFGNIYECRGWSLIQFANGAPTRNPTLGRDSLWNTFYWLGGGNQVPTRAAVDAVTWLTGEARRRGAGLEVHPHNAFKVKACPGLQLTALAHQFNGKPIPGQATPGTPFPRTPDGDEMTPDQARQLAEIHQSLLIDGRMHLHGHAIQTTNHLVTLLAARDNKGADPTAIARAMVAELGEDLAGQIVAAVGRVLAGPR